MTKWISKKWNSFCKLFEFPDNHLIIDTTKVSKKWDENNKSCPMCLFPLAYLGVYQDGVKMRDRALCNNCGWEGE